MKCKAFEVCTKLHTAVALCGMIGDADITSVELPELIELKEINQQLVLIHKCLSSVVLLLSQSNSQRNLGATR